MTTLNVKTITSTIFAILMIVVLNAQTIDDAVIKTDTNSAAWTTGKIQRPWVNNPYVARSPEIYFNDVNMSVPDGNWTAVDVSDNLKALDYEVQGNVSGTLNPFPDTMAETPIKITYRLNDTLNAHHGVMGEIDRKIDRYEIEATIAYTDTATGQPAQVTFKLPNHLAKVFMDWDTTLATPYIPLVGADTITNPLKFDSILSNIHDVMVLPQYEQNKENLAQMNETSPYSGLGDVINSTLEKISDGGVGNPWYPEGFSMAMTDHSKSSKGKSAPPNTEGASPPDKDDLDAVVYKLANGKTMSVKQLMPSDTVVTYPGATWGNTYEITVSDTNYVPDVSVNAGNYPTKLIVNQVNDTTYNVTVAVKTPNGQPSTQNIVVQLDETIVGTPEIQKPDYSAANYPNPFDDQTTLRYSLKDASDVNVDIYDAQGKLVNQIFSGKQQKGTHKLSIDGSSYAPGMYFLNITSPQRGSQSLKLLKKSKGLKP